MNAIALSATVVSFIVVVVVFYRNDMIKSVFFPFMLLAVSFYQLGNLIEIFSMTADVANVGFKIRFLGVPFISSLWYLCVLEFCGITFNKKRVITLLFIVPIVTLFLSMTWESNHLLFSAVFYPEGNFWGNPRIVPGRFFGFWQFFQFMVSFFGFVVLAIQYLNGNERFRRQILLFLASALIPLFNMATFMVRIGLYNVDVTPYALVITATSICFLLYKVGVVNQANIIKENALNYVNEGVILFDLDGVYMDCNLAAQQIFPELNRVPMCTEITDMPYLPFNAAALNENNKKSLIHEFTQEGENLLKKTFGVSVAPIKFKNKPVGYGVILHNISSIKKIVEDLEEKSSKDPLTSLYNRGYLFSVAESWLGNSALNNNPFSVIMFDIDHFKKVNDTHGHVYGDYVLKELAKICSIGLRQSDILGRYGGEEFCLLLFNTHVDGAYVKAETLRNKIFSHRFVSDGIQIGLTCSFGVAEYEDHLDNETFTEIVKRADANLYKAKNEGRNRVC